MVADMPAAPQSSSGGEAQYSICQLEPPCCAETGGFVWTVHNFSKIRDTVVVSEPGCCLGGVLWSVRVYPKGNNSKLKPEEVDKILSVYLDVHNAADLSEGWKRSASFKLTLLSHRRDGPYLWRTYPDEPGSWEALPDAPLALSRSGYIDLGAANVHTFDADSPDWGNPRFVALSQLNDPTKGFLHDDTLKIEARIAVFHDTQQAERIEQLHKYVESLHGDQATSDAEVRVGDASFLTHKFVLGQAPFFQTKFATEVGEEASGRATRSGASKAAAGSSSARVVVTVEPEEVTPDAFKVVLESLYKVDTPPPFPHGLELLEVHAAAKFLGLSVLQRACEAALGEEELSVEELVPYLCYAKLHGLTDLKEKCFEFATDSGAQLSDFMATKEFLEMATKDNDLYKEFLDHLSVKVQNSAEKKRRL